MVFRIKTSGEVFDFILRSVLAREGLMDGGGDSVYVLIFVKAHFFWRM